MPAMICFYRNGSEAVRKVYRESTWIVMVKTKQERVWTSTGGINT
jgi:hypothetical protein